MSSIVYGAHQYEAYWGGPGRFELCVGDRIKS